MVSNNYPSDPGVNFPNLLSKGGLGTPLDTLLTRGKNRKSGVVIFGGIGLSPTVDVAFMSGDFGSLEYA